MQEAPDDGGRNSASVDELLSQPDSESSTNDTPQIIDKPHLLEIDNIPDENRIVGLDDKLSFLAKNLRKMQADDIVDNVLEWGETGTGKTLVAKHVSERLEALTTDSENPIVSTYLNVDVDSTQTSTFRTIAEQVNQKANDPVRVPEHGLSAQQYRKHKLWPVVEEEFSGGLIVIIDEIDKHPDIDEILYTLSRAASKDGTDAEVVTIGISNDTDFRRELDSRALSTLSPEDLTFTPYTEAELIRILENRRDAFEEGVLEDGVIEKTAEFAAKEHGDARRALRLFRKAGEIAKSNGDSTVTTDHVDEADKKVDVEVIMSLIRGATPDGKLLLFAISRLKRNNPDKEWFRTSNIVDTYQQLSRDVESEPLSYNRALEQLNKHVTTGLLESKKIEGGTEGTFRSYSLQSGVKSTRRALINSTPALQKLMGDNSTHE